MPTGLSSARWHGWGRYSVEVGFPGAGGGELWVHLVSDAGQAAAYFSAAYQHRKIDFTGFEKEEL